MFRYVGIWLIAEGSAVLSTMRFVDHVEKEKVILFRSFRGWNVDPAQRWKELANVDVLAHPEICFFVVVTHFAAGCV